ncbi:unnamed protein product [Acanthoscelides obtectus]|uniref:PiggyBac transposable element-derived protein domain-containing protein n=1 Tax=Acanthoscelides obtectus TaxID=200917 RepID=A0A9P0M7P5_ACAOB|nr:unnamed protein product [Acanthoscelides obtectus]CAK1624346.1 Chimeric ERCC6-PGBD3 protein [Acanthoscelides obtectus]
MHSTWHPEVKSLASSDGGVLRLLASYLENRKIKIELVALLARLIPKIGGSQASDFRFSGLLCYGIRITDMRRGHEAGKSILTDKDLEAILNDSDFYLSDDEEEVVPEVNDTIEASDVEEAVLEPPDADPVPDTVEEETDDDVPLSKIRDQLRQKHKKNKKTRKNGKEEFLKIEKKSTLIRNGRYKMIMSIVSLLDHLLTQGILGTGTIMNNLIPRDFRNKMKNDKELLSEGRGSFDEFIREDKKCTILKWMDNRSVTMASSSTGSAPQTDVRRWDKKNSKYILVPCPNSVTSYNRSMGGVDLCDRLISYYRICMRTKKWPVRVFWHFIDLSITNSCIEYRQDCNARGDRKSSIMDLLEFKLYIGKCLALGAQTTVSQDPSPSTPDEESSRPAKKCKKKFVYFPRKAMFL